MRKWLTLFLLAGMASAFADNVVVLEINKVHRFQFEEHLLTVDKDMDMTIEAAGAADRYGDDMLAMGWILDSATRKVVWELTPDNTKRRRSRFLREAKETIAMKKGIYEVYYAVSPMGVFSGNYKDLGDVLSDIFGGNRRDRDFKRYASDWHMTLSVDKKNESKVSVGEIRNEPQENDNIVVQFIGVGNSEYEEQGITLTKETDLDIYAIGEGEDGEMFDYGWIVDAKNGETVWQMKYRDTDRAGGAHKNRMVDTKITLDKGDYIVTFVTDDSHSYDEWNMMPPRDPRYWGITITCNDKSFKKDRTVKMYEPKEAKHQIVDMTRAGNNYFEEQGFILNKKTPLKIRCIGEMGSGRQFVDYGWILDAESREVVWEMTRRNTRHAGGGGKNRLFDGVITLDAGRYMAYYVTDGSHAYRKWNVGAPFNPRAYGLAIYGHGEDFDPGSVKPYHEKDDPAILAQLIRAENNERLRARFTLDKDTDVRIYCLGEGDDDDMFDYGWIENENDRRVWSMDYWDTDHAGGAKKNRVINEVVHLKAGEYTVYYRTDGSHSYEDWNDDPPRDPKYWGITVRLDK